MRRVLHVLLIIMLLLAAAGCGRETTAATTTTSTTVPETTTTTVPESTTTTTRSYHGTYNTLSATERWEQTLLKTAPVRPVAHTLNAEDPVVQVIYLNNYPPAQQQSINLNIVIALQGFPVELLREIAPLRIYIQNSAQACMSRHVNVGGCTGGGHSLLMVIGRNMPNGMTFQETLIHEIGHLLDWHERLRGDFAPIRNAGGACSAPGTHAQSSLAEDIASSFTLYAMAPEVLKQYNEDRYAFFHERYGDLTWAGQELPEQVQTHTLRGLEIQEWNCEQERAKQ